MTTDGALAVLPTTGDPESWSPDEKALLAAAGLMYREKDSQEWRWAPRPTVVAFLAHCSRTGLDPIAKQIYAIRRGGEWGIQVSIDGMRVVAQRSGEYEGQTPVEWTADGVTWVPLWLSDAPPAGARVGVMRRGFREPLYAVARFRSYVTLVDEWAYDPEQRKRVKTGKQVPSGMWAKGDDFMLAKVAEALALRKAFPMDLSGLYIAEELDAHQDAALNDAAAAGRDPEGPRSRVLRPSAAPAAAEGTTTPDDAETASAGRVASAAGDPDPVPDAAEGDLVQCARCGEMVAGIEPGMICGPCEVEVEREIEEARDEETAR